MVNSLFISRYRRYVRVHSEVGCGVRYQDYEISSLRSSRSADPSHPLRVYDPKDATEFRWTSGSKSLDTFIDSAFPIMDWNARTWWPGIGHVPDKLARIVIYDTGRQDRGRWIVAQYYPSLGDPSEHGCQCKSNKSTPTICRFAVVLDNPRLAPKAASHPSRPLIAISSKRVGWIDVVHSANPNTPPAFRFKMIAFPAPNYSRCPCLDVMDRGRQVTETDIPHKVLGEAHHIVIEEATGVVRVIGMNGKMRTYRYV